MDNKTFGESLHSLLKEINFALARGIRFAYEPLGITRSQSMVLALCARMGGSVLVSQVCEAMSTPPSNVTNICNRLEKSGLLIKQRGESDRRKVTLTITPEGQKLVDSIHESHKKVMSMLTAGTVNHDREVIVDGLTRLNELLKQNIDRAGLSESPTIAL